MSYISTEGVYLLAKKSTTGAKWEALTPITEFPDMWSAPDSIDVTTMSDTQSKSIKDIIKLDALEFSAFYDKDDITDDNGIPYCKFSALTAYDSDSNVSYALAFGMEKTTASSTTTCKFGKNGILKFSGTQSSGIKGGSVSAAVEVGISIYPKTQVTYSSATSEQVSITLS